MDRLKENAGNIRKLMRETEGVTDESMIALAKLKIAMIEARRDPAFTVGVGQTALMRLSQAEGLLVSASSNLLRVHSELSDIARSNARLNEEYPTNITDAVVDHARAAPLREEVN